MEEKERILKFAADKFMAEGFYKTTMDEIASELKVSKKTIYKYFPSKDELLLATTTELQNFMSNRVDAIIAKDDDSIDKLLNVLKSLLELGLKINNRWIQDLQVYKPDLWEKINTFRKNKIKQNFSKIFEQGIKEGYLKNIPVEISMTIYLATIQAIISPDFIMSQNIPVRQAMNDTFDVLIAGQLTEKGRKVFESKQKEHIK